MHLKVTSVAVTLTKLGIELINLDMDPKVGKMLLAVNK